MILQNRFYLGELPDGGRRTGARASTPPMIDPDLFDRAAGGAARTPGGRSGPGRPSRGRSPGSPSAARCGKPMVANGRRAGGAACGAGRIQGNGCAEPSFYEDLVDDQMAAPPRAVRAARGGAGPARVGVDAAPERGGEHGRRRGRGWRGGSRA